MSTGRSGTCGCVCPLLCAAKQWVSKQPSTLFHTKHGTFALCKLCVQGTEGVSGPLPLHFQMQPTPLPFRCQLHTLQKYEHCLTGHTWGLKKEGAPGWHRVCDCNPEHPFSAPHLPWDNLHLNNQCSGYWVRIFGKLENRERKLDEGVHSLVLLEALNIGSEIPTWALNPINCFPKLAKINIHWQQTFRPASLGKGWRPADWRRDMVTNAGKGAGLQSEPFEITFFKSFPLIPPMFLPKPRESSGKCWNRKICLFTPGRLSSPATTVPYLSSPELPTRY